MICKPFRKLDRRRMISGVQHVLIERDDGFQFYLDPAFLAILEQIGSDDIEPVARQFGVELRELEPILQMLEGAGLIDRGSER